MNNTLLNQIICNDCKTKYNSNEKYCPNCGCPNIETVNSKIFGSNVQNNEQFDRNLKKLFKYLMVVTLVFILTKGLMMGSIRGIANDYYNGVNDFVTKSDLSETIYNIWESLYKLCALSITVLWILISYYYKKSNHKISHALFLGTLLFAISSLFNVIELPPVVLATILFFIDIAAIYFLLITFYKKSIDHKFKILIVVTLVLISLLKLFQLTSVFDQSISDMQYWYNTLANGLFYEIIWFVIILRISKSDLV